MNQTSQMSVMEQQLLQEYQELSRLCQAKCRHYSQKDEQVRSLLREIERNERQNEQTVASILGQSGTGSTMQ
ncbi:MAG: hypothetical protein ACM3XN_10925 [Chloroflexota bacterium]